MFGEVSARDRVSLVGTDEDEPGIAHPCPGHIRSPRRVIHETERLNIQDSLEALHGFFEIPDDEIQVMYAIR